MASITNIIQSYDFNGSTSVASGYIEYTSTHKSGNKFTVTLKLFGARIDWAGEANCAYTTTTTSPSSWTNTYDQTNNSCVVKNKSFTHLCTRTFDVTANSSGDAYVDMDFVVSVESSSSGWFSVRYNLTYIECDPNDITYSLSISEGTGVDVTVIRNNAATKPSISNGGLVWGDDELLITVSLSPGYKLKSLEVNGSNFTPGNIYYPSGNVSVVATAELITYTLSISAGTGTSISVKRGSTVLSSGATLYYNDSLTISYSVNTGYAISAFTVNSASFTSGNTKTVTSNITVKTTASVKSFKLSISRDSGVTLSVVRSSSPLKGASTGALSDGATIYYSDVLSVTYAALAGYELLTTTLNDAVFESGKSVSVSANVAVVVLTKQMGLIYIDTGTELLRYLVFVDTGTEWVQCIPHVDDGTKWNICS